MKSTALRCPELALTCVPRPPIKKNLFSIYGQHSTEGAPARVHQEAQVASEGVQECIKEQEETHQAHVSTLMAEREELRKQVLRLSSPPSLSFFPFTSN